MFNSSVTLNGETPIYRNELWEVYEGGMYCRKYDYFLDRGGFAAVYNNSYGVIHHLIEKDWNRNRLTLEAIRIALRVYLARPIDETLFHRGVQRANKLEQENEEWRQIGDQKFFLTAKDLMSMPID